MWRKSPKTKQGEVSLTLINPKDFWGVNPQSWGTGRFRQKWEKPFWG